MYFSRITFNPLVDQQQLAQTLCQDAYREHQALWQLFDSDPEASRDFLYRQVIENGRTKYYLLSKRAPIDQSNLWSVDTHSRPFDPKFSEGQRLYFTLRANPVVTHKTKRDNREAYLQKRAQRDVKDKTKLTSKRVRHDVVMEEKRRLGYQELPKSERPPEHQIVQQACSEWLSTRSERLGFGFESQSVIADGYQKRIGRSRKHQKTIRFSTVDFHGVLTVIDPEKFKQALLDGIGRSKAFGCGLLLVRRI